MQSFVYLLVGLMVGLSSVMAEPTFEWVAAGGGVKNDKTRAVAFDAEGNVYLAGETTGDGRFGELERKGLGEVDFFLAKVSKEGRFLWVRSLGGSRVDRGYGVVVDSAGNAYVTGHYQSVDAVVEGKTLPNAGDYDVFVAKYDPAGSLLWLRTAGSEGYDYGHGIALDPTGAVVVSGAIAGEARFGDVVVNAGGKGRATFCAKYQADGELLWARSSEGAFSGSGHGVGVDGQGQIYIAGSGRGVGSWGPVKLDCPAGQAALVIKLSAEGEGLWAAKVEGQPSAVYHEVTVDATGRVWCAGMFKGEATLASGAVRTSGDKDSDGMIVHYTPDGREVWSQVLQSPGTDYCLGVATDGTGRCFLTGEFSQTASFAGQSHVSRGSTDIFVAALDEKGAVEWFLPAGAEKGDNAYTLAWHPSGRLVLGGGCTAPAQFGEHQMESPGAAEAYGAVIHFNSKTDGAK